MVHVEYELLRLVLEGYCVLVGVAFEDELEPHVRGIGGEVLTSVDLETDGGVA